KLLSVGITPETAVPTEIYYGNNSVTENRNGSVRTMTLDEFDNSVLSAMDIDLVQIAYDNSVLENVKDVKLVDMPGFDSGFERHNKALDNYLPTSLAYILAIPADQPVLKESVVNFLRELGLHDVPVYIVITKCDKVAENSLPNIVESVKNDVSLHLGVPAVSAECIRSRGSDKNADGLKRILTDIQSHSDEIFDKFFAKNIKADAVIIEDHIARRLKAVDMSVDEIDVKIDEYARSIERLESDINDKKASFERQSERAVEKINNNVRSSLDASLDGLASMLQNGQDVNSRINLIIRNAVSAGIKSELEPAIAKFADGVQDSINVNADISFDKTENSEMKAAETEFSGTVKAESVAIGGIIGSTLTELVASGLSAAGGTAAATGLGATLGSLAGPLGIIIGAAIGVGITSLFSKKKEEQAGENCRGQMSRIIDQVAAESAMKVDGEIRSAVNKVSESILSSLDQRKQEVLGELEAAKREKQQKSSETAAANRQLEADLETVRRIINEL
ncbi:MAG: dynamin family protein, partial [Oscillospiraceae bacterium]